MNIAWSSLPSVWRRSNSTKRIASAITLFVTCGAMLGIAPVSASPILMTFQGSVRTVDSLLSSSFLVGDTLWGTYIFESSTAGHPAPFNPHVVVYPAVTDIRFNIADYEGSFAQSFDDEIRIHDQLSGGGLDRYELLHSFAGPSIGLVSPSRFSLLLGDPTASAFPSAELPSALPPIASFSFSDWYLQFCPISGRCQRVGGTVDFVVREDSKPATEVSEPATLALLSFGLAGIAGSRFFKGRRGTKGKYVA